MIGTGLRGGRLEDGPNNDDDDSKVISWNSEQFVLVSSSDANTVRREGAEVKFA